MNQEELKIFETLKMLLEAVQDGKATIYKQLVSENLTCFEPETHGYNVKGLDFHLFFLENLESEGKKRFEIVDPSIRVIGECAYISYVLIKTTILDNELSITSVNETRIFELIDHQWKMIHFHRSPVIV